MTKFRLVMLMFLFAVAESYGVQPIDESDKNHAEVSEGGLSYGVISHDTTDFKPSSASFWQQAHAHSVYRLSQMVNDESVVDDQVVLLGKHILAEFLCCEDVDADYDKLADVLRSAAQKAHATVLNVVTHKFFPMGMSGVAVLSESHIAIHTWPEYGYVAVDIYTCGEHVCMQAAIDELSLFFKPKKIRHVLVKRGYDCC